MTDEARQRKAVRCVARRCRRGFGRGRRNQRRDARQTLTPGKALPDTLTYLSLGVAAYAVGVSTYVGVTQARRESRRDRRSVAVRTRVLTIEEDGVRTGEEVVSVEVVNEGHRPVEIQSVHFRLANGYDLHTVPQGG